MFQATPVTLSRARNNSFYLEAISKQNAFLVVNRFFNNRWYARVNGESTDVIRVNLYQLGIPLPAGKAVVELIYRTQDFTIAMWLTLLAIILWMWVLLCGNTICRIRHQLA
jgi:uncharacterized membrane protein YfhO